MSTAVARAIPRSLRRGTPTGKEKARAEGCCRMCLRPARVRPLTVHHLVPQWWWKRVAPPYRSLCNANANVVPLCRPCHDLAESPDREVRRAARLMVRRAMTQAEIAFAIACMGKTWFDDEYPPTKEDRCS